jgi:hypothetical protein
VVPTEGDGREQALTIRAELLSLVMVGVATSVGYAMWALGFFLGPEWQPLFTTLGLLLTAGLVIAFIKVSRTMSGGRLSEFYSGRGGIRSGTGGLPAGVVNAALCLTFVIAMAAMATGRFLGLQPSLAVFASEFIVWLVVGILIVLRR